MPTLVLLAGPNGAGKTSFIHRVLRQRAEAFRFVNPDAVSPFLPRWEVARRAFSAVTEGARRGDGAWRVIPGA